MNWLFLLLFIQLQSANALSIKADDIHNSAWQCYLITYPKVIIDNFDFAERSGASIKDFVALGGGYVGLAFEAIDNCHEALGISKEREQKRDICETQKYFLKIAEKHDKEFWPSCKSKVCTVTAPALERKRYNLFRSLNGDCSKLPLP